MITTLTLNPAFDIHVSIKEFQAGRENLASSVTRDVGGKGINISRALSENGVTNTALAVLGSENAPEFREGLREVGLDFTELTVPGRIRENITIHPELGNDNEPPVETRLSFKGFSCSSSLLDEVESKLDVRPGDIVTFTGSLPGGIGEEAAERFLVKLRGLGALIVIDSKSIPLDALRRIKPWLIKPNGEELEAYFGKLGEEEMISEAKKLHADGITNVMVSLGADGALLVCDSGVYRSKPPKIDAVSTIGAGDSSIAGFIAAYSKGIEGGEALRLASAYGTAACLLEGTQPPRAEDINNIKNGVAITEK